MFSSLKNLTEFQLKSNPIRFCHNPSLFAYRGACFAKGILNKFWREVRACVGHDRAELSEILLLFLQRMACENGLSWQNGINVTTNITTGRAARRLVGQGAPAAKQEFHPICQCLEWGRKFRCLVTIDGCLISHSSCTNTRARSFPTGKKWKNKRENPSLGI